MVAVTIWTFVGKVMSLLCNALSRFVTAFFPSFNFVTAVTVCSDHAWPLPWGLCLIPVSPSLWLVPVIFLLWTLPRFSHI